VKRILIVDDSALIRSTLRAMLEARSWIVCGEAANGCDGIDKAQVLHPDLIVLDLAIPLLNGIDASRMLKRLMPATPIIMFTTFTDPYIASAAFAAGVHAVVNKSEGATTLIGSIHRLLEAELPPPPCAA
jgi:two-component system, NarL family, response regulator LiaR